RLVIIAVSRSAADAGAVHTAVANRTHPPILARVGVVEMNTRSPRTRVGCTDIAVVADHRGAGALAVGADVTGGARVAVVAGAAIRFERVRAQPGRWIACSGGMALVERYADHGSSANAAAGLTPITLRTLIAVVARRSVRGKPARRRTARRSVTLLV